MSAPHRQNLARRLRAVLARHRLLDGVEGLLVGFSGGADSTALLLLLADAGPRLTAIHLHHGLRGAEADADAEWCRRFCAERNLPFELHHLHVPERRRPRESLEAAARRCRIEFWQGRAGPHDAVALGHHADDCLEELLLRLARGANASGLTALRPRRTVAGVRFIRPLLGFRRAELEACLREHGVHDWRIDRTNRDPAHRRNAVRHRWLPPIRRTLGGDAPLLAALAALRDDADCLEQAAAAALDGLPARDHLATLHPALLPRVLRLWLSARLGRDVVPSRDAVERLRRELVRPDCGVRKIPLGNGVNLIAGGREIGLETASPAEVVWRWRDDARRELPGSGAVLSAACVPAPKAAALRAAGPDTVFFAEAALPAELTVRVWRPGDRMIPFGHHRPRPIKDLFSQAAIPRWRRPEFPLVVAGGAVIWVAGLRRAAFAGISPGVRRAVRLRLETQPRARPHTSS